MDIIKTLDSLFSASNNDIIQQGESRWWNPFTGWTGGSLHAGEPVTEGNLLTSSTCFACSKVLSETGAGLPSTLFEGSTKKTQRDPDDPVRQMLCDQPNEDMDSFTFMELLVNRVVNSGNFFAEIERNNRDEPVALWPIHPSRVQPMQTDDGELYWEVARDYVGTPEYSDPSWREEHLYTLSKRQMLNIVGFGSLNGIIGPGVLPGAQEISLELATRRYGADFFKSGATPSGFVTHPAWINDPTKRANFRSDLNLVHNNRDGQIKHGIGVLWEGATYNQVGIAPEQAQFLETRKFTSHQICKLYGVPPAMIGDFEDSKFATADAMIRTFVMTSFRNLVVRIERAINRQVLRRRENGRIENAFNTGLIYEMALDGLLRGDPKTQAETHKLYRDMGVLSANDILQDLNRNTIDGKEGDYRIVAGGYTRLEQIDNQGTRLRDRKNAEETAFQKDLAIEGLSRLVSENKTQVPGADLDSQDQTAADANTDANEVLIEAATECAEDAFNRIHSITQTQIERWREQDPASVESKLEGFWSKQADRLKDSLEVADKLREKAGQGAVSTKVSQAYFEHFSALDNYSIFDSSKTEFQPDWN